MTAINLHLLAKAGKFQRGTILARLNARRREALLAARFLLRSGKADSARRLLDEYWRLTKVAKLAASWQAFPPINSIEV